MKAEADAAVAKAREALEAQEAKAEAARQQREREEAARKQRMAEEEAAARRKAEEEAAAQCKAAEAARRAELAATFTTSAARGVVNAAIDEPLTEARLETLHVLDRRLAAAESAAKTARETLVVAVRDRSHQRQQLSALKSVRDECVTTLDDLARRIDTEKFGAAGAAKRRKKRAAPPQSVAQFLASVPGRTADRLLPLYKAVMALVGGAAVREGDVASSVAAAVGGLPADWTATRTVWHHLEHHKPDDRRVEHVKECVGVNVSGCGGLAGC